MPKIPRRKRWPGLSPATSRHVERQLRMVDWDSLTQAARDSCKDCPGRDKDECTNCPINGIAQQALMMSAYSRAARHTPSFLAGLPVDEDS